MKLKTLERRSLYETPVVVEVDVTLEGILCDSSEDGSTGEMYDRVGDTDGWAN